MNFVHHSTPGFRAIKKKKVGVSRIASLFANTGLKDQRPGLNRRRWVKGLGLGLRVWDFGPSWLGSGTFSLAWTSTFAARRALNHLLLLYYSHA